MFCCEICGVFFDRPSVRHELNGNGSFWWKERFESCPVCGEGHFFPVEKCECGSWRDAEKPLCGKCRKALLEKLFDFADYLTESEETQLDLWLDGNSIKDRRTWA